MNTLHEDRQPLLQWTDNDGVLHAISTEGAIEVLRYFYGQWPGGVEEHQAQVAAEAPMVDLHGNPRRRYIRVIHKDRSCVLTPAAAAELVAPDPTAYLLQEVYLSAEEFNALPQGGPAPNEGKDSDECAEASRASILSVVGVVLVAFMLVMFTYIAAVSIETRLAQGERDTEPVGLRGR